MAAFKQHTKFGIWQDMRPEMVDVTTPSELPSAAEYAKKLSRRGPRTQRRCAGQAAGGQEGAHQESRGESHRCQEGARQEGPRQESARQALAPRYSESSDNARSMRKSGTTQMHATAT